MFKCCKRVCSFYILIHLYIIKYVLNEWVIILSYIIIMPNQWSMNAHSSLPLQHWAFVKHSIFANLYKMNGHYNIERQGVCFWFFYSLISSKIEHIFQLFFCHLYFSSGVCIASLCSLFILFFSVCLHISCWFVRAFFLYS